MLRKSSLSAILVILGLLPMSSDAVRPEGKEEETSSMVNSSLSMLNSSSLVQGNGCTGGKTCCYYATWEYKGNFARVGQIGSKAECLDGQWCSDTQKNIVHYSQASKDKEPGKLRESDFKLPMFIDFSEPQLTNWVLLSQRCDKQDECDPSCRNSRPPTLCCQRMFYKLLMAEIHCGDDCNAPPEISAETNWRLKTTQKVQNQQSCPR